MTDFLIIGGGAMARVAALALSDGQRQVRTIGVGTARVANRHYALSAGNLAFLRELGVVPPARAVARFCLHTRSRRVVLRESQPLCFMVTEAALNAAMTQACERHGVACETAATLQHLRTDDAAVTVRADGRELRARCLVVADGGRSPMARQLGVGCGVTDFRQSATVATVCVPGAADDTASQWFFNREIIALLPCGESVFSVVWSGNAPEKIGQIENTLREKLNLPQLTVNADEGIARFPLVAARRAVRAAPRTVFVGDAAFVLHPLAGQGINQGLEDVRVLRRCLHNRRDVGAPLALSAYAAARQTRTALLHQLTVCLQNAAISDALIGTAQFPPIARLCTGFANPRFAV